MGILQPVKAYGHRSQSGFHELLMHRLIIKPPVCDYSYAESTATNLPYRLGEIRPQKRFSSGKNNCEIFRAVILWNSVQRPEKVPKRHVLFPSLDRAIAPAMAAIEIAARGALPEKIIEFVHLYLIIAEQAE